MEKKKKKRKNIKHMNEEQLVAVSPEPSCSTLKVYVSFKVKVGNECGKVE